MSDVSCPIGLSFDILDMARLIGNELTASEDGKREHILGTVLPVPESKWSGLQVQKAQRIRWKKITGPTSIQLEEG
jgi:hypothetical protein